MTQRDEYSANGPKDGGLLNGRGTDSLETALKSSSAVFGASVSPAKIEWMELCNMHNSTHFTALTALITARHMYLAMGGRWYLEVN